MLVVYLDAMKNTLLKRREVADMLRVSTRTVRAYEIQGALHPVRINARAIRYKMADVQKLIDGAMPATTRKEKAAS